MLCQGQAVRPSCTGVLEQASRRPIRTLPTRQLTCRAAQRDQQLQLFSPAKAGLFLNVQQGADTGSLQIAERCFCLQINIFLRILGKRPDGYHDLASLFHVSSCDHLLSRDKSSISLHLPCKW